MVSFIYQSGDDDYERLPNADAEIDPPCVEAVKMLVVKNLEKSQSTATHRMIKEPRSSCVSYQGIFALSLISKSSPLKFRFRMVSSLKSSLHACRIVKFTPCLRKIELAIYVPRKLTNVIVIFMCCCR